MDNSISRLKLNPNFELAYQLRVSDKQDLKTYQYNNNNNSIHKNMEVAQAPSRGDL